MKSSLSSAGQQLLRVQDSGLVGGSGGPGFSKCYRMGGRQKKTALTRMQNPTRQEYSLSNLLSDDPPWRGVAGTQSEKKELPQVILAREMIKKLRQGEFWIYREQIKNLPELATHLPQGGFVRLPSGGLGLFDNHNPIALRALDVQNRVSDAKPYVKKAILRALEIRKIFFPFLRQKNFLPAEEDNFATTGIRLLHGENDFLSGLTADLYKNLLVYRPDSISWFAYLTDIDKIFREHLDIQNSYITSRYTKGWLTLQNPTDTHEFTFRENNFVFILQPEVGQKTGFFLDMRSNRAFIETLSRGKHVLNAFSYTCAFSLYALRGGAASVTNIDISSEALRIGEQNHALNGLLKKNQTVEFISSDIMQWFKSKNHEQGKFDLIILDPPAYAHTQDKIENALHAYRALNKEAFFHLRSGQYLATTSCSPRVSYQDFFAQVMQAADESNRRVRLVYAHGADVDHPYAPNQTFLPYLKFLVFYVESN